MTPTHPAPTIVLGPLVQIDGAWRQNPTQRAFAGDAYIYVRAGELPAIDDLGVDPVCKVKLFHPCTRFTYYAYALTEYPGIGPVLSGLVTGLAEDEVGDTALREIAELRVAQLPAERDLYWEPAPLSQVYGTARS